MIVRAGSSTGPSAERAHQATGHLVSDAPMVGSASIVSRLVTEDHGGVGPVTGWVAGVVGIVGIIYTIWSGRRTRHKRIHWQCTADTPVMATSSSPEWGPLTVQLAGKQLESPRVINVRFSNTGSNELKRDVISIPPTVTVEDGQVVAATVEMFTRGSRTPVITKSPTHLPAREVVSEPVVLNPGDALVFQLLLDGSTGTIGANFQAAGFRFDAKTFAEEDARKDLRISQLWIPFLILFVVIAALGTVGAVIDFLSALNE